MDTEQLKLLVVLIIVVTAISAEIVKYYLKTERQKAKDTTKNSSQRMTKQDTLTGLITENKALKSRIEVLESLVTEDSFELKQQFKRL